MLNQVSHDGSEDEFSQLNRGSDENPVAGSDVQPDQVTLDVGATHVQSEAASGEDTALPI